MEKYDDISDEEFRMYQILVNEDIMNKEVRDKIIPLNVGYMSQVSQDDDFPSEASEDDDLLNMDGSNMISYILNSLQNQLKNLEFILTDMQKNGINSEQYYEDTMAEIKVRRGEVRKLRAEAKYLESADCTMEIGTSSVNTGVPSTRKTSTKKGKVEKEYELRKRQVSDITNAISEDTCNSGPKKKSTLITTDKVVEESQARDITDGAISEYTCSSEPRKRKMTKTSKIAKKYQNRKCEVYNSSDESSEDTYSSKPQKKKMTTNKVKGYLRRKCEVHNSSDDSSEDTCNSKPEKKKITTNKVMEYNLRKCQVRNSSDDISEATCSSKPNQKMKATNKAVKGYLHRKGEVHNKPDDMSEATCSSKPKKKEMTATNKVVKEYLHRKSKAHNRADDISKDRCSSECKKEKRNKVMKE